MCSRILNSSGGLTDCVQMKEWHFNEGAFYVPFSLEHPRAGKYPFVRFRSALCRSGLGYVPRWKPRCEVACANSMTMYSVYMSVLE